jgi:pentatricopeptide repeat protein
MSARDAAYNPLAYHNGTVWPHDNSLIAAGLARYGRWEEAWQFVRAMLGASSFLDHELPEVFAGLPRGQTPFPIAYPTAARPQAWAAGTPILLCNPARPATDRRSILVSVAPGLLGPAAWVGRGRAPRPQWDVR